MFNKKIISLISLLLVTGSSYIIFYCIENNNDEVNLVDNSIDDNINEEELINEDAESSNSFLNYSILFIIVIIVAVILFFAIKRIVDKKKKKTEEKETKEEELKLIEDENIESKIPELKKDQNYTEDFNKYIKKKEELNDLIKKLSAKKDMKKITDAIIAQMKKDYLKKENEKLEPAKHSPDDYLVDFYYGDFDRNEDKNVVINDNNRDIFIKNNEEIRDISVYQPEYKHIVVNLFIDFFEETVKTEGFQNDLLQNDNDYEQAMYVFIAVIIEPFLKCVSERKDVRFISEELIVPLIFQSIFFDICDVIQGKNFANDIKKTDLSSISNFIEAMNEKYLSIFGKIFDGLINYYFPESKELNEKAKA